MSPTKKCPASRAVPVSPPALSKVSKKKPTADVTCVFGSRARSYPCPRRRDTSMSPTKDVARGPGLAAGAVEGLEEEAHRRRHLRLRLAHALLPLPEAHRREPQSPRDLTALQDHHQATCSTVRHAVSRTSAGAHDRPTIFTGIDKPSSPPTFRLYLQPSSKPSFLPQKPR
mmetsp:Transcript_10362/g.31229  ORF Transcript_10362/g.31229 Transcript_10362/m.31229 type:complete len:171 (+) Transcript_10362:183-695(+)